MMIADIVSLDLHRKRQSGKTLIDPVIAAWKCRIGICREQVGVTQTAFDTLALFNDELAKRRQRLISIDEVMLCPYHAEKRHEDEQGR